MTVHPMLYLIMILVEVESRVVCLKMLSLLAFVANIDAFLKINGYNYISNLITINIQRKRMIFGVASVG